MGVRLQQDVICLTGECTVEDAETLLNALRGQPASAVDVTEVGHLHAAVLQVLMAFQPVIAGPTADPFGKDWLSAFLT